jgi:D-aspartate ligase
MISSFAAVVIGDHTQGLGIVRSAAAARAPVWVVNDRTIALARVSRHVSGYTRLERGMLRRLGRPDVAAALVKVLLDLPVAYPSLLFGVDDEIVGFIGRNRRLLGRTFAIPDVDFEQLCDKYVFASFVPERARIVTHLFSETDARQLDPRRYVVKGRQGNAFRRITGRKAISLDELSDDGARQVLARIPPEQVLVQQLIESDRPVVSMCSFSVDGRLSAVFAYEKLREHPARFGTGTYLRSVAAEPLAPLAADVIRRVNFTGISEIEFILDRRTNSYKVIEMNPRTWKSVHFATRCGQNLVARYLRHLAGATDGPEVRHASGRCWVDLATDIPEMLRRLRVPRYPSGCFECTWERSDPWPALALWTLFPLIALENRLASIASSGGKQTATSGMNSNLEPPVAILTPPHSGH